MRATSALAPRQRAPLMMRPYCLAFMPGSAALLEWKAALRLMERMASHLSSGNSSTGLTC